MPSPLFLYFIFLTLLLLYVLTLVRLLDILQTIDQLIETGDSEQIFQKAIQEHGRGQVCLFHLLFFFFFLKEEYFKRKRKYKYIFAVTCEGCSL